jgi:putative Holliday junction resolvase
MKTIASPLEFIPAEPLAEAINRLKQIIAEKNVGFIVIGMPRNMDGSYGPAAQKVEEFIRALKAELTLPMRTWDERLTTVQANKFLISASVRRKDRKEKVDRTAAAILLQSFLDATAG